jgi:hypothetical protein
MPTLSRMPILLAGILVSSLLLAFCAIPPGDSSAATKVPFPINGATVCSPNPATPSTSKPKPWFAEAKREWKLGSQADAVSEGLCWTKAADDLESIATVATTGTSGFQTAADQLLKLASLPDAMDTSAQESEAHSLFASLDRFFGTPGRYEGP